MEDSHSRALLALSLTAALVATPLAPLAAQSGPVPVDVWITTGDQSKLLAQQAAVAFAPDSGSTTLTIDVDSATTYQQMDGFGASFTDSSAWLVANALSAAQRDALMHRLFDASAGIGLSDLRQPMGASDFALKSYTYDDVPAGEKGFQSAAIRVAVVKKK